jgi:hypothetical protein
MSRCFLGLLQHKTRLLVTHQLQALRGAAHRMVYLSHGQMARVPPSFVPAANASTSAFSSSGQEEVKKRVESESMVESKQHSLDGVTPPPQQQTLAVEREVSAEPSLASFCSQYRSLL